MTRTENAAPAPHRIGHPSPLVLHLAHALAALQQATLAAPLARDPRFPWHAEAAAEALAMDGSPDPLDVAETGARRLSRMIAGIEAWQRHPYRRTLPDPPEIWSDGVSRLLDYGAAAEAADPGGPPVLIVPSLINRAYILDLDEDMSLMRHLAAAGLRPLLLDWGAPGAEERDFTIGDFIARRLRPALAIARALGRGPVPVVGYCMGGTLGAALAVRASGDVAALATIGTPWDFSRRIWIAESLTSVWGGDGGLRARQLLRNLGQAFGAVPDELFQALFAALDPGFAARKFRRFARLDPDSEAARRFVAVEDWLNDGPPVPAPAAEEILVDWHVDNRTARGDWQALGGPVDPERIRCPVLSFCAPGDRIAPPGSTRALPAAIEGARIESPGSGHVGMIVGRRARSELYEPLTAFLLQVATGK